MGAPLIARCLRYSLVDPGEPMARNYWKIICTEDEYPGLWNTWFKERVVAVGWSRLWGFKVERGAGKKDHTWSRVRACLGRMKRGDRIVVQLPGNHVARVGHVVSTRGIADEVWNPTVPRVPGSRKRLERDGEMGRRIAVRWSRVGPTDPDLITVLPDEAQLSVPVRMAPLVRLKPEAYKRIRAAMQANDNWVRVVPEFKHESALSDYIAVNPTRLGSGMRAFPAKSVREHVFRNGKRSDVLLVDRSDYLVVVECKQGPAEVAHLRQLHGYMRRARELRRGKVRGILVHGGPRRIARGVREAAKRLGITTFQHSLAIDFDETS